MMTQLTENQLKALIEQQQRKSARPFPNSVLSDHDAGRQEQSGNQGVNAAVSHQIWMGGGEGGSSIEKGPWNVAFAWDAGSEKLIATFSECHYFRDPITVMNCLTPLTYEVTNTTPMFDTYIWLAAKIDTETGKAEIIQEEGGVIAVTVIDATVPVGDARKYIKKLLYLVLWKKNPRNDVVSISIYRDYRHMMQGGAYV